jgi:hypothetical protein
MKADQLIKEAVQLGVSEEAAKGILAVKDRDGKKELEGLVDALAEGRDVKE